VGAFTGIQPFQWPDSEELRIFLFSTVVQCAGGADSHEETVIQENGPWVETVVAGPLCESGDVFTQQEGGMVETRALPAVIPGDY
ncbi:hypothetical protein ONQ60_27075, partial [Salmonella enterica subsp. enterica serovar Virginia]|nr:hypothetical protein [Salmonella enterica subsp. enterica serovar Virginia]